MNHQASITGIKHPHFQLLTCLGDVFNSLLPTHNSHTSPTRKTGQHQRWSPERINCSHGNQIGNKSRCNWSIYWVRVAGGPGLCTVAAFIPSRVTSMSWESCTDVLSLHYRDSQRAEQLARISYLRLLSLPAFMYLLIRILISFSRKLLISLKYANLLHILVLLNVTDQIHLLLKCDIIFR